MRCKEAAVLISLSLEKRLGLWGKARLRIHTARCDGCRNLRNNFLFLRRSCQDIAKQPE